jgi:hypothetical protein
MKNAGPYSRARLTEPRPSGSGNAKDGVIESGMLIGFPRCSPTVCFSTEWYSIPDD